MVQFQPGDRVRIGNLWAGAQYGVVSSVRDGRMTIAFSDGAEAMGPDDDPNVTLLGPGPSALISGALALLAEAEVVHPEWTKADAEFMIWRLCGVVHGLLGHNVTPKDGDV